MRRFIHCASVALILAAVAPATAGDGAYHPDPAVVLKGGVWTTDINGVDAAAAYGVEIAVDDPLIRPTAGKVRDMLSFNHADHDGLRLTTLEWNAHWAFETRRDFWVGLGPGVGYVWCDGRDAEDGFAAQFGGSLTYVVGHAVVGVETRYQWTGGASADNWLTMAKVGYQFQ